MEDINFLKNQINEAIKLREKRDSINDQYKKINEKYDLNVNYILDSFEDIIDELTEENKKLQNIIDSFHLKAEIIKNSDCYNNIPLNEGIKILLKNNIYKIHNFDEMNEKLELDDCLKNKIKDYTKFYFTERFSFLIICGNEGSKEIMIIFYDLDNYYFYKKNISFDEITQNDIFKIQLDFETGNLSEYDFISRN